MKKISHVFFIKSFIFVLIVLVLFQKQEAYSQRYSLDDCINLALKNNHDIIFSRYQRRLPEASKKASVGAYLPSVGLNAGYGRQLNNINSFIEPNSFSAGAQANLLIFDGFARETNYNIADIQLELFDLETKFLFEQVRNTVYLQYIEIMRLSEITKAREEDIKFGKMELDNLKAKFEAQMIPINSVLAQEAELGNKEVLFLQSQIDINLAKQKLLITLGIDPTKHIEFYDSSIPRTITKNDIEEFKKNLPQINNLVELAFKNRIDYSTYNLSKESARLSKKITDSEYYPTVTTSLGYNWHNSKIDNFNIATAQFAVNLTVPIFNNFSIELRQQQADLKFEQENILLLKAEQNIRAEVQTAYLNLEVAEKSVEISEKAIVAAKQNFDATIERLKIGSATITDYITANTQYITAQINNISTSYMYLKSKRSLLFSIGEYKF